MEEFNEVLTPPDLRAGDRVILSDGYADVVEVVKVGDLITEVNMTEDGGEIVWNTLLDNSLLLEVQRTPDE